MLWVVLHRSRRRHVVRSKKFSSGQECSKESCGGRYFFLISRKGRVEDKAHFFCLFRMLKQVIFSYICHFWCLKNVVVSSFHYFAAALRLTEQWEQRKKEKQEKMGERRWALWRREDAEMYINKRQLFISSYICAATLWFCSV